MPEAMSDASDRFGVMADQTPKLMSWKRVGCFEQLFNGCRKTCLRRWKAFVNIKASMQDFIENNPEYMQTLASIMSDRNAALPTTSAIRQTKN